MSLQPIKTAFKYVGAWSMVAAFVALLTIIFSFLGTLFCAALGGMMMGVTKAAGKLSVAFSVLCPAVLLALLRFQKSELPQRQIIILMVICLAAFWAIYIVSAAVMALEQKQADGPPAFQPNTELRKPAIAATPYPRLQLKQLDGHWCCEGSGDIECAPKRTL